MCICFKFISLQQNSSCTTIFIRSTSKDFNQIMTHAALPHAHVRQRHLLVGLHSPKSVPFFRADRLHSNQCLRFISVGIPQPALCQSDWHRDVHPLRQRALSCSRRRNMEEQIQSHLFTTSCISYFLCSACIAQVM